MQNDNGMSILKRIITLSLLSLLVTGFMTSCDKCIYDDLTDCPQGVIFKFHTKTPCDMGPTYPQAIKETRVFAFDEKGVLVSSFDQKEVALSKEYEQRTDYLHVGTSSFVAWGGEDLSKYDFSTFEAGKTTKEEMTVALKRQAEQATADMPHLFVGTPINGDLTQKDHRNLGTHYDTVDFRMQQLTNTVRLTVHGLNPDHEYAVIIKAENSRYNLLGESIMDSRFSYISPNAEQIGSDIKADFRLLKLEQNKDIKLIITDKTSGKVIYNADLIDDLIAYQGKFGTSPVNLKCEHNFVVVLDLKPCDKPSDDTYIAIQATINQWNIVFRDVEL